jgi:hypothetical protein
MQETGNFKKKTLRFEHFFSSILVDGSEKNSTDIDLNSK